MLKKFPSHPSDVEIPIVEDDVLFNYANHHTAIIQLNRPKKLNSLNISMIDKLFQFYLTESKSPINLVIQKSVIPKAFCAGGDVVVLAKFDNAGHPENSIRLFETEYSLNYFLSKFKKPVVSLMNGITMGGGVGLSIHGPFRVVTELTKLAMPEMAIGFFPDVGASFFFSRMDDYLGWYVCLTGDVLVGYDNLIAGTGTHFVPEQKLALLEKELVELSGEATGFGFQYGEATGHYHGWYMRVNETIEKYAEDAPDGFKFQYSQAELKIIHDMFDHTDSIEGVFDFLQDLVRREDNSFAKKTLDKFHSRSLLSVKLAYKILQYSATHNNYESLSEELNLAKNMNLHAEKTDLPEGIYKKLILKTNDPQWLFKDIHDIPDEYVNKLMLTKVAAYGNIYKFKGNDALFPDSKDYTLNHFGLPKQKEIVGYLAQNKKRAHSGAVAEDVVKYLRDVFPQYRNKKGVERKVQFALQRLATEGKLELPRDLKL